MKTITCTICLLMLAVGLSFGAGVNYTYDAAGRLTAIDYGAGGSITYTYDAAGNITSRTVLAGSLSPSIISAARLTQDKSRIEVIGTNLAPSDGGDLTVTLNGAAAHVISTCNASEKGSGCRADRIVAQAPAGIEGRIEVRVKNGARQEAVWQSGRAR